VRGDSLAHRLCRYDPPPCQRRRRSFYGGRKQAQRCHLSRDVRQINDPEPFVVAEADALARSALMHGGWHEQGVETLVVEACVIARANGTDDAFAHMEEVLNSNLRTWRVSERIHAVVFGRPDEDPHIIGRCFLSRHPEFWGSLKSLELGADWLKDFRPAVLVTEVEAHDEKSARWRASEAFAEARAILRLASGSNPYGVLREHFVLADSGTMTVNHDDDPTLVVQRISAADGTFWPGYRELSFAAAKRLGDRTDWERRVLGAARWYDQAVLNSWPAASLVAAMSAIEALFCFPGERRNKDEIIADRLIERNAQIRGVRNEDRRKWFTTLYGRWRNNAAHDAHFYREERDVERLIELSESVIRWAITHLDPHHVPGRTACGTIHQAHGHHD
jgi:hypothetical protein